MSAKYHLLASELRTLCARLQQQGVGRLPGEEALCIRYGCSRQTVRHALDVLEAEGLVLRMRGSGTYLAGGIPLRSLSIAVLAAGWDEYLYPRLLRDLKSGFAAAGLRTEAFATGGRSLREREILSELLERPPAGILLEPVNSALPSPNLDLLRQLSIKEIPLVWLRSALPEPQHTPVVTEDNEGGARMLVRYLLNKGHRDIAGIFRHDDRSGHERYLGFLSELMSSALPAEDRVLWYGRNELEAVLDGDMEPLLRFIRGRLRPCSAAVCHNDRIAEPLIRCLLQAGLRVPEDIAVVSFDNSPLCRLAPVPITSLSHARQHLGDAAVRTMTGLLRGRSPHKEVLGWTLRERQSG